MPKCLSSPQAMYYDAHVHSRVSPDSEADPGEIIGVLKKQGLGVCFTEHVDYVTPVEGLDKTAPDIPQADTDFLTDLDDYPASYLRFKSGSVGLGLEIGLTRAYLEANRAAAALDGLDFIVGSIHFVDGYDIYYDYCASHPGDPYRRMLEYIKEMVELCEFFDSLGHIDYISRYSPLAEKNVLYTSYPGEYDALLKALIKNEKALEINTSRFGDPAAEANLVRVYRRYYQLGGRYVTIGSDAHRLQKMGRHHGKALRIARDIGLRPVCYFNRKMEVC